MMEKLLLALLGLIGALFLGQKFKSDRLEKKLSEAKTEEKKTEVEKKSAEIGMDNFSSLIAELSELKKVKASKPEVGEEKSPPASVMEPKINLDVVASADVKERQTENATPSPAETELPEPVRTVVRNQASRTKTLRGI